MKNLRILIVDDQRLMRDGLRTIIDLEPDMTVAGTAENGVLALSFLADHAVDLVLMDVRMPEMDGVSCTKLIRERYPDTRVLILSTFAEDQAILEALRAGASGYLLKDLPAPNLVTAIREAVAGVVSMQPEVMARLLSNTATEGKPVKSPLLETLTLRELEILSLMAEGLLNREIAGRIFISEGTVKNYISTIYEKLGVKDRTQAVLIYRDQA